MKKRATKLIFKGATCATVLLMGVGCETLDTESIMSVLNVAGNDEESTMPNIEDGLREALTVGIKRAVTTLSADGGYTDNPKLKIPIPESLEGVESTLKKLGLGSITERFRGKMGEAAEQAATLAQPVFTEAITEMSFDDVKKIFNGGDTAATDYLKAKTSGKLKEVYLPIVKQKMDEVGAVGAYNAMVSRYNQLPLVTKVDFNIEDYVTTEALKGMFTTLGEEEKKIRRDPAARTTELLKSVFSMAAE